MPTSISIMGRLTRLVGDQYTIGMTVTQANMGGRLFKELIAEIKDAFGVEFMTVLHNDRHSSQRDLPFSFHGVTIKKNYYLSGGEIELVVQNTAAVEAEKAKLDEAN